MRKYTSLSTVAFMIRTIGLIVSIAGIAFSVLVAIGFWPTLQYPSVMVLSLGIPISIIFGILIYAFSDLIMCIIDIEYNTREISRKLTDNSRFQSGR